MHTTLKQKGFTIVELLIVIVVIGILAAITIVAYSGIQQRASEATLRADLSTSAKKMAADNVLTGSYPLTAAAVDGNKGLTFSTGTTYQFQSTGTTYCITGTNRNTSFKVSDASSSPTKGGCPGDGQGGIDAITNMVVNPSMSSITNISAAGATGSNSTIPSGGFSGDSFVRRTFTGAGAGGLYFNPVTSVTPGVTYTASVYTRGSVPANVRLAIEWKTSGGSQISNSTGSSAVLSPSVWTRLDVSGTAPPTASRVTITAYLTGSPQWANTNYQDIDAGMLTEGSTLTAYADGDSLDWMWNGSPNNATSTGPAL